MKELYTTYNLCIQHRACMRALTLWSEYNRGVFDPDAPIPMIKVIEVFGADDCLWALRTINDQVAAHEILYKYSYACAKRIVNIFAEERTAYQKELVATAKMFLYKLENGTITVNSDIAFGASHAMTSELAKILDYGDDYILEQEWQAGKLKEIIMEKQNE